MVRCFYHRKREAVDICSKCNKSICARCKLVIGNIPVCCNCWEAQRAGSKDDVIFNSVISQSGQRGKLEKNKSDKFTVNWKYFGFLIGIMVIAVAGLMIFTADNFSHNAESIALESVGTRGEVIELLVIDSPNIDNVLPEDLIKTLQAFYKGNKHITAYIFDNHVVATIFNEENMMDTHLITGEESHTISDVNVAEFGMIYSHWFAQYSKNIDIDLHELLLFSRDTKHKISGKFELP